MCCRQAVIEADLQSGATAKAQGADTVGCDSVYRIDRVPIGATAQEISPFTSVQYHFYRMRDSGLLDVINAVLVAWVRVSEGRSPAPNAGVINSQSVKTNEAGGPRGYDAEEDEGGASGTS